MIYISTTNITNTSIPKSMESRFDGSHDFRKSIYYSNLNDSQKIIFDLFVNLISNYEVQISNLTDYDIFLDIFIEKNLVNSVLNLDISDLSADELGIINNFINMIIQI